MGAAHAKGNDRTRHRMSVHVKGFGCGPLRDAAYRGRRIRARVRKPPRKEPAGAGCDLGGYGVLLGSAWQLCGVRQSDPAFCTGLRVAVRHRPCRPERPDADGRADPGSRALLMRRFWLEGAKPACRRWWCPAIVCGSCSAMQVMTVRS